MVGLVAAPDASLADVPLPIWEHLVGAPHSLRVQAESGIVWPGDPPGHADSWGVGWFDQDARLSLVRETGSAAHSPYFVFASETAARGGGGSGPASAAIGHLRKASCGVVNSENAHPVQAFFGGTKSILVAHNGTIYPPLLDTIKPDLREAERVEAGTDSDTVALAGWLALQFGKAGPGTDAFATLTGALRELFRRGAEAAPEGDLTKVYSGVNLLIAHPAQGLFVLRHFSREPEYYTLFNRRLEKGGWVIASEPTDTASGWEPMEPGTLVQYPTKIGDSVRSARVV